MTLEIFVQGVGVACAIATTGFLLAIGWHAGTIAGAWLFGPHHSSSTFTLNLPQSDAAKDGGKK